MWDIENMTPFAAERGWVRDRDGAEVWLTVVKATFDIKPDGSTEISRNQPPVLHVPEYFGTPGESSIKYDSDMILSKRTTDVIVVGQAYAPSAVPVKELDVAFRVGDVKKAVRVYGERKWGTFGLSEPLPFTTMPLVYERAFGGADGMSQDPSQDCDWRNPVGCGYVVSKAHLQSAHVPNVEFLEQKLKSWDDRPPPAGFGVIAPNWKDRAMFAGTYDDEWMNDRQPLLPKDFDERFFQSVPADQQSKQFLKGGEQVVCLNLSKSGRCQFVLPKLHLGFETDFYDGESVVHQVRNLHSVIIELDYQRVSLVWHSSLQCHFKVQKLKKTMITLKSNIGTDDEIAGNEEPEGE